MAGVNVDVSSLTRFADRAVRAIPRLQAAAGKEVEETARRVQTDAKQIVPVDTGALQGSIDIEVSGLTAEVFTTLRYAPFVEFGTYKDRPQPFITPAADRQARDYPARMGAVVVTALRDLFA